MSRWSPVLCLVGAALTVGWPASAVHRRRRVLGGPGPAARLSLVVSRLRGRALVGWAGATRSGLLPLAALGAGAVGLTVAGPVGAIAAAAYGGLAVVVALRRRAVRDDTAAHARCLDALGALAAELRAGLPAVSALSALAGPAALGGVRPRDRYGLLSAHRVDRLARAAVLLAEETGAPLADLLDRIAADGRAARRAAATAAAQAAGARATAWLLAGLPAGGIALGYGIGADPLRVLLHTPFGAGCAVAAIGLQLAGLAWSGRLARAPEEG